MKRNFDKDKVNLTSKEIRWFKIVLINLGRLVEAKKTVKQNFETIKQIHQV